MLGFKSQHTKYITNWMVLALILYLIYAINRTYPFWTNLIFSTLSFQIFVYLLCWCDKAWTCCLTFILFPITPWPSFLLFLFCQSDQSLLLSFLNQNFPLVSLSRKPLCQTLSLWLRRMIIDYRKIQNFTTARNPFPSIFTQLGNQKVYVTSTLCDHFHCFSFAQRAIFWPITSYTFSQFLHIWTAPILSTLKSFSSKFLGSNDRSGEHSAPCRR